MLSRNNAHHFQPNGGAKSTRTNESNTKRGGFESFRSSIVAKANTRLPTIRNKSSMEINAAIP
jgi:hypothetical protein